MKGFINILKPVGISSASVVNQVKRKFLEPCGHMGTLDPMASGVLPVGIGKTSRLFPFLLDKVKVYVAGFKFGLLTDTLDTTGETVKTCDYLPDFGKVKNSLGSFIGEIEQMPPKYSAKNVAGKKAYQLSRQGVDFELKPKRVTVYSIELLEQVNEQEFKLKIVCGGGTYIRSLARDIGLSCDSLAVMSSLERVECGIFNLANGVLLDDFINCDKPEKFIIRADEAVNFPKLILQEKIAKKILNGVFPNLGLTDGLYRVYNANYEDFWGIGRAEKGVLKIISYVR